MNARTIFVAMAGVLVVCVPTLADWTEPMPVSEINTAYNDKAPFLSFDGLTLYFNRSETDTFYYRRIYQATRPEPYGLFTSIEEISTLNYSGGHVSSPWVSQDDLRMYYCRNESGSTASTWKLKVTERTSIYDPWQPGTNISELNALGGVYDPSLTADELTIFFGGYYLPGSQGYDIWMATRPDMSSPFGNVRNLTEINSFAGEVAPYISPDGLVLHFISSRNGTGQAFKATRASVGAPFGNLEHLSFLDSPGSSVGGLRLSSDGTAMYFNKKINGQPWDAYVSYLIEEGPYEAAITRIGNAIDEKVNALERINASLDEELAAYEALEELLESGDYGDLRKGDIIRAMQEVHSAIQHEELSKKAVERSIGRLEDALTALGWEPPPAPQPVSHWKFDEGSGTTAYDSVGNNHGIIHGATWTTGKINGALDFDGVGDYVYVPDDYSLDLGTHDLSFAFWFKTNESSVEQMLTKRSTNTGPNNRVWDGYSAALLADGTVAVHFRHSASSDSDVIVTSTASYNDDNWHHLAGVYTRSANLVLYVDGVPGGTPGDISYASAADIDLTQPLAIGCRVTYWQSNPIYFNGLIDDVRVYNKALSVEDIQELYESGLMNGP